MRAIYHIFMGAHHSQQKPPPLSEINDDALLDDAIADNQYNVAAKSEELRCSAAAWSNCAKASTAFC